MTRRRRDPWLVAQLAAITLAALIWAALLFLDF